MSYYQFIDKINKNNIQTIFELGSRDLEDAIQLMKMYNCKVYAFECNPDCLIECKKRLSQLDERSRENICLIDKAISIINGDTTFYPFDLTKYNNMGSSSMLKIDFSMRTQDDPDYNRENPQKEITVIGTRLDTFIRQNNIPTIDLLCIDLQGYELNALKSVGAYLHNVKYIITECSVESTYKGGATFSELNDYLNQFNFQYVSSNKFGHYFPDLTLKGFSEFDALFIHKSELEK